MERCLKLAKLGQGRVSPNPMVGSVIVHGSKIIGEGYHEVYGEAHAEVNAIKSVKDQSLLRESTIYVNLEPCAHFGKTPPCANLIIEKKLKRVVIGCIDPFAEVAGKGVQKLKAAGIEVILDVLNAECLEINKRFFTFHEKKRPYVILKWAQSLNGLMDIDRAAETKGIFWITQPETKSLVHQWRAKETGILVGRKTIENDNPELTCRAFNGNDPIRFIIDCKEKLDVQNYKIAMDNVPTYIFTENDSKTQAHIHWVNTNPFTLQVMLEKMYHLGIQSVIIEGGKTTLQGFIDGNLWDEARILSGTSAIPSGVKAPVLEQKLVKEFKFGQDKVTIIRP